MRSRLKVRLHSLQHHQSPISRICRLVSISFSQHACRFLRSMYPHVVTRNYPGPSSTRPRVCKYSACTTIRNPYTQSRVKCPPAAFPYLISLIPLRPYNISISLSFNTRSKLQISQNVLSKYVARRILPPLHQPISLPFIPQIHVRPIHLTSWLHTTAKTR
jgi:hypothetical protein